MDARLSNHKVKDSSAKMIFGDATLCAQFLRGYVDVPLLKDVQPEDIEDVTERYVHMFTEERNSDIVKKIRIQGNTENDNNKMPFYLISLIEHKSKVDYNLKFYTKSNGKPVKSRLPVFCLHVVYRPDLVIEKIFLVF